ncbi:hypothetical protein C1645_744186 [Glomus cerebriforme]|uniref:Uncharacterized protein n=1 Tax=Glomus cerebriforme TaxID=658196 RepID=A0A397SC54_9GLOM|nr:hypothetical protein C1645_744186 [Glomus cerebriforme]
MWQSSLCFRFDTGIGNGSLNSSVQNGRENEMLLTFLFFIFFCRIGFFRFQLRNLKRSNRMFLLFCRFSPENLGLETFSSRNLGLETFGSGNSESEKKHSALKMETET